MEHRKRTNRICRALSRACYGLAMILSWWMCGLSGYRYADVQLGNHVGESFRPMDAAVLCAIQFSFRIGPCVALGCIFGRLSKKIANQDRDPMRAAAVKETRSTPEGEPEPYEKDEEDET